MSMESQTVKYLKMLRETKLSNTLKCHGKPNCQLSYDVTGNPTVKYLKMSRETKLSNILKCHGNLKLSNILKCRGKPNCQIS